MQADSEFSIYVVDDEESLGEMARQILALRGHKAIVFTDPEMALESIRTAEAKPKLLITDGRMGPMNGLELIGHYNSIVPDGKTILLSGTVTYEHARSSAVRLDRFIAKPYSAAELLSAVEELLADFQ